MNAFELENLIENILIKVLNKYVEKQHKQTNNEDKKEVPSYPNSNVGTKSWEEFIKIRGY